MTDSDRAFDLDRAVLAIRKLQARVRELESRQDDAIAVIGAACRLPAGVRSPADLAAFMRSGKEAVSGPPAGRWGELRDAEDEWLQGGYLEDVHRFDAAFFGISAREAALMDPQHRLLLEVTWDAIEDAASSPDALQRGGTGVFVGITSHDYRDRVGAARGAYLDSHAVTGNMHAFAAGRISYSFGFRGPALAIDTACSSSLVSLHLAAESLRRGECDTAVAAGVNLILSPVSSLALGRAHALARDGRCKSFDASADGYGRAEGCVAVVLKRLDEALRDGDPIRAVILSTSVNQDGRSAGLTAPSVRAQVDVLRKSLERARIRPDEIDFLEAHGTGTLLGDPIEIAAIREVYDSSASLTVGSIKSNLGHLEPAAGLCGLVKLLVALEASELFANRGFSELNPHIDLANSGIRIAERPQAWPRGERKRRAALSSFGLSGTNAHAIVEEAPLRAEPTPASSSPRAAILALSARTSTALARRAEDLASVLERPDAPSLASVERTLALGRTHLEERAVVRADSLAHAAEALRALAAGEPASHSIRGRVAGAPRDVALLFSGQGSQYSGMGRGLYDEFPVFATELDRCCAIADPILGLDLRSAMWDPGGDVTDTRIAQPALFALEWSLQALWQTCGIEPAVVLGHSLGEYIAATVAGVFSLESGLRLVCQRGLLMHGVATPGAMIAIDASEPELSRVLRHHEADIAIAAKNGLHNHVLSGEAKAIAEVAAELTRSGHRVRSLETSHAFHSPLQHGILDEFEARVTEAKPVTPEIPILSNLTGRAERERFAEPAYWREHLRRPVLFHAMVAELAARCCAVHLEIGPHGQLVVLGRQSADSNASWIASLRRGAEDAASFHDAVSRVHVAAGGIDWSGVLGEPRALRVALPTYPWEGEVHRADALPTDPTAPVTPRPPRPAPRAPRSIWTDEDIDAEVRRALGEAIGDLGTARALGAEVELRDVGVDSMIGLELLSRLESAFALAFRLGDTAVRAFSIREVRALVRQNLVAQAPAFVPTGDAKQRVEAIEEIAPPSRARGRSDLPANARFLRARFGERRGIEFVTAGEGPTLLLLPPMLCTAAVFKHQIEAFSASHRVIVPHYPGYGRSERDRGATTETIAAQVHALLEALDVSWPIDLIGWSFGGMVAQRFVRSYPQRSRRCVLVNTSATLGGDDSVSRCTTLLRALRSDFDENYPVDKESSRAQYRRLLEEAQASADLTTQLQYMRLALRFEAASEIRLISCPVLVLQGERDLLTPPVYGHLLHEGIPSSEYAEIAGGGHFLPLICAEQVNPLIARFLQRE